MATFLHVTPELATFSGSASASAVSRESSVSLKTCGIQPTRRPAHCAGDGHSSADFWGRPKPSVGGWKPALTRRSRPVVDPGPTLLLQPVAEAHDEADVTESPLTEEAGALPWA